MLCVYIVRKSVADDLWMEDAFAVGVRRTCDGDRISWASLRNSCARLYINFRRCFNCDDNNDVSLVRAPSGLNRNHKRSFTACGDIKHMLLWHVRNSSSRCCQLPAHRTHPEFKAHSANMKSHPAKIGIKFFFSAIIDISRNQYVRISSTSRKCFTQIYPKETRPTRSRRPAFYVTHFSCTKFHDKNGNLFSHFDHVFLKWSVYYAYTPRIIIIMYFEIT